MNKTGNKELAATLTDKHGLSKSDAESFVAAMFEMLGDGLQSDKQVKIKGLGTFKVVGVASRKSVDVNTGDPIIINGRDKISFTPDASLRDNVNRPFAQFETVAINDGIDFSEIDDKYNLTEEKPNTEPTQETKVEIKAKPEDTQEDPKAEEVEAKLEDTQEEPKAEEEEEKQEDKQEEPKAEEVEEKQEYTQEEPKAEEVETEPEAKQEMPQVEEKPDTESDADLSEDTLHHGKLKYIVAAVAVIAIISAAAFYLFKEIKIRDHRIEHLEAQVSEYTEKKPTAKTIAPKTNKVANQSTKAVKDNTAKATKDDAAIAAEDNTAKKAEEDKAVNDFETISRKDSRIRTGAYIITGIDHTVIVKENQTLASISRAQLGPGMECYIEAVNGGQKEFKAGEKVNVPKLKLKKK